MNRDKHIEEMARVACVGFHGGDCENCPRRGFCSSYTVSRKLYRNGWRKASEVVKLEEKLADVTANWQKLHDAYDADCIEHYNKGHSEAAREIFEEIEEALNRKIARSKPQFEKLHRNEKDLSVWGYKDIGYFQGIISTCEDMQDIIAELKKKCTEGKKEC